MRKWMMLLPWLLSWTSQASENLPRHPVLTFEIAVKPESELHQVITTALKDIFQKLGYEYKSMYLPPKRGLQELKAGRLDGSVGRIGNVASFLESKDLIRVDFPIAIFQISRWCRKDLPKTQKPIKLGTRLGTLVLTLLKEHMSLTEVQFEEIAHQKSIIQMLHSARIDCILSSDLLLETDGLTSDDMRAFDRFDLVSFEIFPWISIRHKPLKEGLEKGLKNYPFPAAFRKKFLDQRPACEGKLNVVCPDGLLIKERITF